MNNSDRSLSSSRDRNRFPLLVLLDSRLRYDCDHNPFNHYRIQPTDPGQAQRILSLLK